ncbi:MAG: UDP-2,3-diacylglucosamine diphosphatase [Rubrivivax sp.]
MPETAHLTAPSHWQAIDLLSDLHLCEAMPRTTSAFLAHLEATDAQAVLILGDLFEVWVGDDQRHRAFEQALVQALSQHSRRLWMGFMPGNRDFLVGTDLCGEAGLHPMHDPTLLNALGKDWLLSHGDALCLEDIEYQGFRRMVRSAPWQQEFLAKPFDERWAVASRIRAESQSRKSAGFDASSWADVDSTEAMTWLERAGAQTLIHGHTHRPGDERWTDVAGRVVLSDWDLDGAASRAEVLRLDAGGLRRMAPSAQPGPTGQQPY